MTSADNSNSANAALLGAITTWRQSVERVQHLVDRSMQHAGEPLSPSNHDDFAAALRALYALEAAIFLVDDKDLRIAA